MAEYEGRWKTVKVEVEDGIARVTLNRPEKRNAMSPTLNREMREILEELEVDPEGKVLVLACGNTVELKGSERCPEVHALIGAALGKAGLGAGEVQMQ